MTVVSFVDYQPLARFDADPWRTVKIYEGPAKIGPWTLLETKTLIPVDADSANPQLRSFTTELATLPIDAGWYQLVFVDNGGQTSPTDPIFNGSDLAASYRPLVSDIGALLRTRTKDALGNELGTFTAATRPTYDEVERLIDQATTDVTDLIDYDIPTETFKGASAVISLRTAMLIELSYFPEQVAGDKTAYAQYAAMYKDSIERLNDAVIREQEEEVSGETAGDPGMPQFGFPSAEGLWDKVM